MRTSLDELWEEATDSVRKGSLLTLLSDADETSRNLQPPQKETFERFQYITGGLERICKIFRDAHETLESCMMTVEMLLKSYLLPSRQCTSLHRTAPT